MTLQQARNLARHNDTPEHTPERTPRLRLKPKAAHRAYVDGAWWPQSDDLATELPDLLAVLSVRLGRIDRVLYNLNEWATAPAKLITGGRAVRLDGYRRQPRRTLEVLGLGGGRIGLLVVLPHTDPGQAHRTMMAAADPVNTATVEDLLVLSEPD